MQNLIPLVFIGFFIYLIFSRKGGMGGMGCCGGHGTRDGHSSGREKNTMERPSARSSDAKVVDLHEGVDYMLLPAEDEDQRAK